MFSKILERLKIASLNPMQLASIKATQSNKDILLLSTTGSGKTLAFLLPLLSVLDEKKKGVQCLIVVPSRELAIQIEQVFKSLGTRFKINACYGGHANRIEKNNLSHPPAVLVGTPGRINYHIRLKNVDPESIQTLILDEFDKSLEFGFKDEMSTIIQTLSGRKRTWLISATNLEQLPDFTGVKSPFTVNFLAKGAQTSSALTLKYLQASDQNKLELLFRLICFLAEKSTLVFCNHREAVDRIGELLSEKGIAHGVFHGGMDQEDREKTLIKFRNGTLQLLITTDLASRGLDIPEIEAVVHYQLPVSLDVFTHRNGRTARMKAQGSAYLLLSDTEHIPRFIEEKPQTETLPQKAVLPGKPSWQTLYIAAGKKDKISKMDIVGMLLQKGKLDKEELGRVEVLDRMSFAAVKSDKMTSVLKNIREEKLKGRKFKYEIAG
jgi:superfamily II DNA/RNA helicase